MFLFFTPAQQIEPHLSSLHVLNSFAFGKAHQLKNTIVDRKRMLCQGWSGLFEPEVGLREAGE